MEEMRFRRLGSIIHQVLCRGVGIQYLGRGRCVVQRSAKSRIQYMRSTIIVADLEFKIPNQKRHPPTRKKNARMLTL